MLILNPRLLAIVALIIGGAYVATRDNGDAGIKQWQVTHKADQVIRKEVLKSDEIPLDGEAERVQTAGRVEFAAAVDSRTPPRPLTVENLVAEVDRVARTSPDYVPTIPLMGRLAQAMMKEDPTFITFGDLPSGVKGEFTYGPGHAPKIVLSNDLKRLHDKGVPIATIAPVLAHELDHFFFYLTKDLMRAKTHDVEKEAMITTAAYLDVMKRGGPGGYTAKKKGDGDAVDGRKPEEEDPEVAAYYKFLKKIRASLFGGQVDQLVKDHYGTGDKR